MSPALSGVEVTPNDSANLQPTRALYVGGTGTLRVTMRNGVVNFTAVQAGMIYPIEVSRVYATGTTATGIVALF